MTGRSPAPGTTRTEISLLPNTTLGATDMGALLSGPPKMPAVTPAPPAPVRTDQQTMDLAAEQRRRMAQGEQSQTDLGSTGGVTGYAVKFLGGSK